MDENGGKAHVKRKAFHAEDDLRAKGYWEIFLSAGWIVLFFALQIIWGIIFHSSIGPSEIEVGQLSNFGAMEPDQLSQMALAQFGGMVVAGTIFVIFAATYLSFYGRTRRIGLSHWGLINKRTLSISALLLFAAYGFQVMYQHFFPDLKLQENMVMMVGAMPDDILSKLILFAAVGVFAGLAEEILFRGFLQNALGRYLNIHIAIILSAAIFGLVHGQPMALPGLIILGASFGYIYHITGSLRLPILLHIFNNSLAIILSEFAPDGGAAQPAIITSVNMLIG